MRTNPILMNKPVYFGLLLFNLSKTVMYEFWYNYVSPKYGENAKRIYMDTDSSLFMKKQIMFINVLHKMLKQDLRLRILK